MFGAGSLGSLVGGVLERYDGASVTLVGRRPHVAAVRADGLRVEGESSFLVHPAATTTVEGLGADLAVVTVKSFDTAAAARLLASAEVGAVVSLGNGMGNEATLASTLDAPVVAGTTALGATLREPGRVAWLGTGRTVVGPWTDDAVRSARAVGGLLRVSGLPTTVTDNVAERLWEKLAVNAGINPVTALAGVDNGAVAEAPLAATASAAARETAQAARAAGVSLSPDQAVEATLRVARETAANRSSMARDLAAGRRTEVDAINGHVVDRLGREAAPVNATLASLVRSRGAREASTRPNEEV